MHFLALCGGLLCAYWLAGWLVRYMVSHRSKSGSPKSNCAAGNRVLRSMLCDKADSPVRKPSVKPKRTHRKTG